MLTNHGKSDNSSSDVLTIGNNNSMYIHSGGDDYYLPPSAERDDSSVHSGSERNDSMLGNTIPEDMDDDNLGIKQYGSFAPQSKQDFSSPVSLRPPVRFPTPTVPLPPSRPPTLSLSNQRPSIPPSVANTSAASLSTTTSQYPSSPSNTFQEFLSGEEYKRPVILSPYDDSHFHLVDEKTRAKQSSPPKKAATTSTSTTSKTTLNSSSISNSQTNHASTTSVKSSNGTTTTTFEPKNNQVGLKTLLAQKQQQQLLQQKEDKMETDEKTKEDKKEDKVKDEKPKKTTKTTKKKTKKESDSESEYVNESESDESDKKPSKKIKKKEKIKKPTKPKTTKKETKKEEEKKEITKKETRSSKKEITVSSPKRTLDPSGSENETNGSGEPKSKKNKITSSIIDEPIITTAKPSVETIIAPVVKTTSQIVKEKLEARKSQTRTEDAPKKKSESKQTLAKKQKHIADDKMKQKKSSEAISYYLRAGILFSEGAHFSKEAYLSASRDNKSNYFHDAVNLLQQTVAYLKQIAKMALQHAEIQKAALTHLLLFTTVKVWFKLKSETIVKYKNYLMALMTKVNELGGASTGNSQSTSPAVTSPQSVSTPSPIHSSINTTEGIQKREVEKLCKELDVVSQLAEQEDNLNLQLKNFAVYREDSELMIRVYQGDLMFVTMFIEEELIKLDVF